MNLAAVIMHLRLHAPLFEGRVAGAADYAIGVKDQTWLPFPAAYVVPEDEDAGERTGQGGMLHQQVQERFGVVVVFDNTPDRRGQSVTDLYNPARMALFRALLNWRPPPAAGDVVRSASGLSYVEGALQDFDRARLFYKWTFALDTLITDADGWQEPLDDLEAVRVTAPARAGSASVVAEFDTSA